ncbi:MAG TPA: hypothetical protein VHE09_13190, partial [Rhizomicrobium sp.]|nr:hypothetical protein [Rhizomicrobium sp.]
ISIAAIVFITVLPIAGPVAVWWGFNNHPKVTSLTLATFILALVIAALTYRHFFPNCRPAFPFNPGVVVCENSN